MLAQLATHVCRIWTGDESRASLTGGKWYQVLGFLWSGRGFFGDVEDS